MSKEDKIVFCTGGGCTAKLGAGVLRTTPIPLGRSQPQTP